MKAIILTYASVNNNEQKILKETNIFKLALNQHAEELNPHARIITDYILPIICSKFSQKIISVREHLRYKTERVEYFDTEFKGSTIIASLEYLITKGYKKILIIGDNSVNTKVFQKEVKKEIDKLKNIVDIWQYRNGNFHLPVISVERFVIE